MDIGSTSPAGQYVVSTDRSRLDVAGIHRFLSEESYWAKGRSLDMVRRSIENSLCFGVYEGAEQLAFARVVTDYATFGWICDLFVFPRHQGRGVGKLLIDSIVGHPELSGLKRLLLATRDAHGLYSRYGGFSPLAAPEKWMERGTNV